ncbi:MAG: hypothetical protein ACP5D7_25575 [Limnospira sp.]
MSPQKKTTVRKKRLGFWIERGMAILATLNYLLVLFDLTYIPWRNFYFQYFSQLTRLYDPIKGIEPHRTTQKYLDQVEALKTQVPQTGLESVPSEELLQILQQQSIEMIDTDPFAISNQSGALEKIKNRMRDRIPNPEDSAKQAFTTFWSSEYLQQEGFLEEIRWFEENIQPAIARNYYRSLGESGDFLTYFWRLDLPFILLFLAEFLIRTRIISRRFNTVSWPDAMLWRWYDVLLFIPLPAARVLRIIPVSMRLNQTKLVKLERVRALASRGFVSSFAAELTEAVIIQFINQLQQELRRGNLAQRISQSRQQRYLDINDINEIEAIVTRLIQLTVYRVIPQLHDDIEALLRYNIESLVKASPMSQNLQQIPGFETLSKDLTDRLVNQLTDLASEGPQDAYETIRDAMEDPVGTQLTNQLVRDFGQILWRELKGDQIQKIEHLLVDFLEEVKLNYVQQVDEDNYEQVLAAIQERRKLEGMIDEED